MCRMALRLGFFLTCEPRDVGVASEPILPHGVSYAVVVATGMVFFVLAI